MKKLLSVLLAVLLLVTALPLSVVSVSAATYGDLTYEISDGAVTITDCNSAASGNLTIPSTIAGYPVTAIGSYAFEACTSLTYVYIPHSVTSIGSHAFEACTSLTYVYISYIWDDVASIGSYAFYGCSSLWEVSIPNRVTSIGSYAFYGCSSLREVSIPNRVTSIEAYTFYGCSSLPKVSIPDGVTSIGSYAFYGCSSLTKVSIPDGVTSIEGATFESCTGLTNVSIPDGVTSIDHFAFYCCSSLTEVSIPNSVTAIKSFAFWNCTSLTDVYYSGREVDKENITLASYNDSLLNATWHYTNASGHCGDDAIWTYYADQEKLVISGTGDVRGNWVDLHPRYVIIEEGITGVSNTRFAGTYGDVYVLSLPSTLTNIGRESFMCGARTIIINGTKGLYDGSDRTGSGYLFFHNTTLLSANGPDSPNPFGYEYDGIITLNGKIYYASSYSSYGLAYQKHNHYFETFSNGDFTGLMCTSCKMPRDVSDFVCEHEYTYACDKTCAICYVETRPNADHIYDDEYDADCNACGDIRKVPEKPVEIVYGDADGDGKVSIIDVIVLQQYIAGWKVTLNETSADANGDGKVSIIDVIVLQQYIAGWDVTLGGN